MKIFLSHSSNDKSIAEDIYHALTQLDYDVFFDSYSLQVAQEYNSEIEEQIYNSDIFIFLISPSSIEAKSFTLSELEFARKKWKSSKTNILSVVIHETDFELIPSYLRASTFLEPIGKITPAVISEVKKISKNILEMESENKDIYKNNTNISYNILKNKLLRNSLVLILMIFFVVVVFFLYITNNYSNKELPKSCHETKDKESGFFVIDPDGQKGSNDPFKVYCDMNTYGKGWTVVARSTEPSSWSTSHQYSLGHYDYWIDENNYTYDYRNFLKELVNSDRVQIRFYDHIKPKDMDIIYSFSKKSLLNINLNTNEELKRISFTETKTIFSLQSKNYSVGTKLDYVFALILNDSVSKRYCDDRNTKSAIVILTGTPEYAHSSVCSNGLGVYTGYDAFNTNDSGKRISIAFRPE